MKLTGRKSLLLGISLIMSCIGALGAGIMLGTGLNWWLFVLFAATAIIGSVWTSKILRPVPDVGLIIKYNFPKDAGYYQKGERKTTPVSDNDILFQNLLPNCKVLNINTPKKQKVPKETNWKQKFQKPQNENICLTYLNTEMNGNFHFLSFCAAFLKVQNQVL